MSPGDRAARRPAFASLPCDSISGLVGWRLDPGQRRPRAGLALGCNIMPLQGIGSIARLRCSYWSGVGVQEGWDASASVS